MLFIILIIANKKKSNPDDFEDEKSQEEGMEDDWDVSSETSDKGTTEFSTTQI